jgi:hypothetical protein
MNSLCGRCDERFALHDGIDKVLKNLIMLSAVPAKGNLDAPTQGLAEPLG